MTYNEEHIGIKSPPSNHIECTDTSDGREKGTICLELPVPLLWSALLWCSACWTNCRKQSLY